MLKHCTAKHQIRLCGENKVEVLSTSSKLVPKMQHDILNAARDPVEVSDATVVAQAGMVSDLVRTEQVAEQQVSKLNSFNVLSDTNSGRNGDGERKVKISQRCRRRKDSESPHLRQELARVAQDGTQYWSVLETTRTRLATPIK